MESLLLVICRTAAMIALIVVVFWAVDAEVSTVAMTTTNERGEAEG